MLLVSSWACFYIYSRMETIEHVLKGDQSVVIEMSIPSIGHPKVDCISGIINVQLSIYRRFSFCWKQRANLVGELTMQFKNIGSDTIIGCLCTIVNRLIDLVTNRCHGKGIVVSANVILK